MANKNIVVTPVASRVAQILVVMPILLHEEKKSYARMKNAAAYVGLSALLAFHAIPSVPGLKKSVPTASFENDTGCTRSERS